MEELNNTQSNHCAPRRTFRDVFRLVPEESRRDLCLAMLPVYTCVSEDDDESFASSLIDKAVKADIDSILVQIRDAFSDFKYDEFPQLELHYQDVLTVMEGLLGDVVADASFRPGVVELLLSTDKGPVLIVFNLRGTAEDAVNKISLDTQDGTLKFGVSFSAFDRRIDRWCPITISPSST